MSRENSPTFTRDMLAKGYTGPPPPPTPPPQPPSTLRRVGRLLNMAGCCDRPGDLPELEAATERLTLNLIPEITTQEDLDSVVSNTSQLLVVDFYDPLCFLCSERHNKTLEMSEDLSDISFYRAHAASLRGTARTNHCNVVIYRGGTEIERLKGMQVYNEEWFAKRLRKQSATRKLDFRTKIKLGADVPKIFDDSDSDSD